MDINVPDTCRFFASPSGCRYGSRCRFSHVVPRCRFVDLPSGCLKGSNCRFRHTDPIVPAQPAAQEAKGEEKKKPRKKNRGKKKTPPPAPSKQPEEDDPRDNREDFSLIELLPNEVLCLISSKLPLSARGRLACCSRRLSLAIPVGVNFREAFCEAYYSAGGNLLQSVSNANRAAGTLFSLDDCLKLVRHHHLRCRGGGEQCRNWPSVKDPQLLCGLHSARGRARRQRRHAEEVADARFQFFCKFLAWGYHSPEEMVIGEPEMAEFAGLAGVDLDEAANEFFNEDDDYDDWGMMGDPEALFFALGHYVEDPFDELFYDHPYGLMYGSYDSDSDDPYSY